MTSSRSIGNGKDSKSGDAFGWPSHGGTAHGKVVKKVTGPMEIKGHHVAATADDPQFLVETKAGKRAAHKPAALTKE